MSVLMFIRKHITQQEEWYAFYNRSDLCHNEEYSNTPLEGTNSAIKHSSSSTHPQMSMSNAMRNLCEQSRQKMTIYRANHHVNMEKNSTNFETKPVHDRVTMFASSKIWGLFKASKNFKCLRISLDTWKVCRCSSAMNATSDKHIPKFNRVHTVKFSKGRLHCNCPLTPVWGIPCAHSICVASTMKSNWEYPSHRDVSVLWWKAYLQSAIDIPSVEQGHPDKIKRMFKNYRKKRLQKSILINHAWKKLLYIRGRSLKNIKVILALSNV